MIPFPTGTERLLYVENAWTDPVTGKQWLYNPTKSRWESYLEVVTWNTLEGKPAEFPVEAHEHVLSDVTDAGTAAAATLIDDDTMATATASNIPSAESVKAYVDANGGGVSDHGALTGLADDDHSQYALADGSRGDFATSAQGSTADSALQPTDIASGTITPYVGNLDFSGGIGGTVDNAAVNAAIEEDSSASLHTIGAPRQSPSAVVNAGLLASLTRVNATKHTRGLLFGDSIRQNAEHHLKATIGDGGTIQTATNQDSYDIAGGATVTNSVWSKSFAGSYINIGTGNATFYKGSKALALPILGRQIQVWYWSETGGGTFKVQKDVNRTGTYTDIIPDNAGTAPGTTAASATIDAAEGGATGALRCLTYTHASQVEFVRVKVVGLSGSAKIIAAGSIEVPDQLASRLTGYTQMDCGYAGTAPTDWDNMTDAALTTLLNTWNPDFIFFRGYEDIAQWQNEWTVLVGRIKTILPKVQVIVIGMHNTGDNQPNALDATDRYLQDWCDAYNGVYIPIRNRLGTFKHNFANEIYSLQAAKTISGGDAGTGVFTTTSPHGLIGTDVGKYLVFPTLTGGSGLTVNKYYEPYRILTVPSASTLTFSLFDGTTPVTVGSTVTAGSLALVDTTHPNEDGQAIINSAIMESLQPAMINEAALRGWFRRGFTPQSITTTGDSKSWFFGGPSYLNRFVSVGRVDGGNSSTAYNSTISIGGKLINNNEAAYITGINQAGQGMAWDLNYLTIGSNPAGFTRGLSTNGTGRASGDSTEIYNSNAGLTTLAIGKAGTSASDSPLTVWRNGASSSSKGTVEVLEVDPVGNIKFQVAGTGVRIKTGTNARIGTAAVMVAGVVTVANTSVTANTHISITKTAHGGVSGVSYVVSRIAATSFTITAIDSAGTTVGTDTSTFDWQLTERQ